MQESSRLNIFKGQVNFTCSTSARHLSFSLRVTDFSDLQKSEMLSPEHWLQAHTVWVWLEALGKSRVHRPTAVDQTTERTRVRSARVEATGWDGLGIDLECWRSLKEVSSVSKEVHEHLLITQNKISSYLCRVDPEQHQGWCLRYEGNGPEQVANTAPHMSNIPGVCSSGLEGFNRMPSLDIVMNINCFQAFYLACLVEC